MSAPTEAQRRAPVDDWEEETAPDALAATPMREEITYVATSLALRVPRDPLDKI